MDPKLFERKEALPQTETLSAEEMESLIYGDESFPQSRFLPIDKGGVFKYLDLQAVISGKDRRFYSIVRAENQVIGISELEKKLHDDSTLWIKFLSIDPEFQNRGHASQLAAEVFAFAKKMGVKLETSSYSDDGYERLKNVFNRLASELGVQFIDKGKINP